MKDESLEPRMCDLCGVREAEYKLTLTDLEGGLLDFAKICIECVREEVPLSEIKGEL